LARAGFAALSLGTGAAMAQEDFAPAGPDYWAQESVLARQAAARRMSVTQGRDTASMQPGSADIDVRTATRPGHRAAND